MSTDFILKGTFRIKPEPDNRDAFEQLVDQLELDTDCHTIVLGDDDIVTLDVDEHISWGREQRCNQLIDDFVDKHSVLGAATLQTGIDPTHYTSYGEAGLPRTLALRDYFMKQRDYWQDQLDSLEE